LGFFLSIYKKTYKIFYVVFFVSAFFLFIDSTIQYFFNLNIFTREEVHVNRISSFFGEELIMGSYISRILPIALACSFLSNFKNRNLLNIAMLIISGFLVMYSGERVAAFYYIGTCMVYFSITKKDILKFIIAIFFSILLITTFKTSVVERFYKNTISQFNQTGSILSYRHLLHLKTAYDLYLDKKLLGHGLKSFRHKCSEEKYEKLIQIKQFSDSKKKLDKDETRYIFEYPNGCNTHPHNIYLEHLSELGLIGVIFLVLIFLYAFINLVKNSLICIFNKDTNSIYIAKSMILSGVVLQLFPIIPSGSFFNNWMMIIFNLSIGFYLSTLKIR
jgi:O-antigen ligase